MVTAAQAYVCVMVDCTERGAFVRARSSYGVRGIPAVLFYSPLGERVDEVVGAADTEVYLRKLISRTEGGYAPGLRPDERKLDEKEWRDTHRVFLRNGSIVDGKLEEFTNETVVLEWDPTMTVKFKAEEVTRVEWITIRAIGRPAPKVLQAATAPPEDRPDGTAPIPDRPSTTPTPVKAGLEPKIPADFKSKIEEVLSRLKDAAEERRTSLLLDLRTYGADGAKYLLWRVQTLDPDRTRLVFQALGQMTDFRFDSELKDALGSSRADIRAGAAQLIGDRNVKGAARQLYGLLRDPSPEVRASAAITLGKIGDEGAIPYLAAAALDKEDFPRMQAAAAAIALARKTSNEPALAQRWVDLLRRAPDAARIEIAKSLGQLGGGTGSKTFPVDDVRDALVAMLADDRVAAARTAAAIALGELKSAPAAKALAARLSTEPDPVTVGRICEALGKLGESSCVAQLIELLRHRSTDVKTSAARALRQITKQTRMGSDYDAWKAWYGAGK